jgi:hypothetical protein
MTKRIVLKIVRVIAGIAGVVFWLMPLRTGVQVLLCMGSFVVLIVCSALLGGLDDQYTGYWPDKPKH